MVRNRVLFGAAVAGLAVSLAGCQPVGYGYVAPVYAGGYYGGYVVPVYAGDYYGGGYYGGHAVPVYAGGHYGVGYYGGAYPHGVYYHGHGCYYHGGYYHVGYYHGGYRHGVAYGGHCAIRLFGACGGAGALAGEAR